jgi:tripartite-type tricarboxylate transporter receptor subunit TctC
MKFRSSFYVIFLAIILPFLTSTNIIAGDIPAELQKIKPEDFPRKPIELVVVYPAGGGMDVTARILAKHLEKYVGTKCIVVNKTGGAGMVGHTYLATAAKNDGYTVGVLANTILSDDLLRAKGAWSYKDLEPLAYLNFTPVTWIVNTDSEYKDYSLKQIVDYAKGNPNQLKIAIVKDIVFEFVVIKTELVTGAKFNKIPFQGGAPGITALLGNHVDVANAFIGEAKSNLDAGTVRPIGVAGPTEYPYLKGVPTFNEVLGTDDILFGAWRYVGVPKGVNEERKRFLEAAIQMTLRDPECIKDYDKTGIDVGTRYLTGTEAGEELDKLYELDKMLYKNIGKVQ